jgi:S1-C subfamily serine protease
MARPAALLNLDEPDETALDERSRPSLTDRAGRWGASARSAGSSAASVSAKARRSRWFPVALLVVIAIVAFGIWRISDDGPAPISQADVDRAVKAGVDKAQEDQRNVAPDATTAYQRIVPSLVTIVASDAEGDGKSALGAGVIINAEGSVLTALHVVADGDQIQLQFADGTKANATVTQKQPENDIAVLTPDQLPEVTVPAVMGGGARVGDAVFPVGNPLGLQGTLSAGVVSALDRSVKAEGGTTLTRLIQFDAAVNPGNSGGPLLDRDGHVIGIVTALANPSGQPYFVGIGFAVPIETAAGAAGGPSK